MPKMSIDLDFCTNCCSIRDLIIVTAVMYFGTSAKTFFFGFLRQFSRIWYWWKICGQKEFKDLNVKRKIDTSNSKLRYLCNLTRCNNNNDNKETGKFHHKDWCLKVSSNFNVNRVLLYVNQFYYIYNWSSLWVRFFLNKYRLKFVEKNQQTVHQLKEII